MAIEITNNQNRATWFWSPIFTALSVTFAGVATLLKGTILAFKSVADAVVAAADGGNTGDGTVTVTSVAAGQVIPIVGAYVLECTTAVTNGGIFKLVDPNGAIVATGLVMTAGAGAATVFEVAGLLFTVTDGTTNFIVGDKFTLTVAASGKIVPFEKDGAGGAQIPKYIITDALTSTGAGDYPTRLLISGRVRKGDLVIDSDGDDSNVDQTVIDQLRDFTMLPESITQLGELDNQ